MSVTCKSCVDDKIMKIGQELEPLVWAFTEAIGLQANIMMHDLHET